MTPCDRLPSAPSPLSRQNYRPPMMQQRAQGGPMGTMMGGQPGQMPPQPGQMDDPGMHDFIS